jgi:hypothetical protein
MAKSKRTNNDLQSITQKTKDHETPIPLKTGVNSCTPEGLAVPASYEYNLYKR